MKKIKEKIYLLPGLMTDERLWQRLKPFLEDEYELIHIALPLTEDFQKASQELEKTIKDEKINLLGFSLGAYLASYFTIRNPQRVNRLFLVAGTPAKMNENEIIRRTQTLTQMNNLGFKGLSKKKIVSLLEESNKNDEKLIDIVEKMFWDLGLETYNIQMKSTFNRVELNKELNSLSIPIKIFYSTEDRLFTHSALESFKDNNKYITKVSRFGTSHMIPLEFPRELSLEIKTWMEEQV